MDVYTIRTVLYWLIKDSVRKDEGETNVLVNPEYRVFLINKIFYENKDKDHVKLILFGQLLFFFFFSE